MRMVAFQYDIFEKHGMFVFQSAEYHFSSSVFCDLSDGDVVGFLFDCETATAGFTINGIPQRKSSKRAAYEKGALLILNYIAGRLHTVTQVAAVR
jgi:hypothetical protein